MSSRGNRQREKETSYFKKPGDRAREIVGLGRFLIDEPRPSPKAFLVVLKCFARDAWNARDGGLYAVGYMFTLVGLEVSLLVGEFVGASSIGAFFCEQIVEVPVRFTTESIGNMLTAFMLPVWVIGLPPSGA